MFPAEKMKGWVGDGDSFAAGMRQAWDAAHSPWRWRKGQGPSVQPHCAPGTVLSSVRGMETGLGFCLVYKLGGDPRLRFVAI